MELQDKKYRILDIFFRLLKGEFVSVRKLADEYSVSGKTIYRDIIGNAEIVYDRKKQKYYMEYYDYSVQSHSSTCDE